MRRARLTALLMAVMVFVGAACGGDEGESKERGLDKVTFVLSFLMDGNKAPFVLGKEKGFFEEQGIDVEITEGGGFSDAMKLVANGRFDFGDTDGRATAIGVDKGLPVAMVATHQPRSQDVIWVREGAGIESLPDLEGRTLLMSQDESDVALRYILEAGGADASKIEIQVVDPEQRNGLFVQGEGDGMWARLESLPAMLEADPDLKLKTFPFVDYGFNVLGQGLITHVDTIRENPDLVRRMVAAYTKSYIYAADHQDELIEVVSGLYPEATREILDVELDIALALVATENTADQPFGTMAEADWQSTIGFLLDSGDIETEPNLEDIYTNEFIGDWEYLEPQGEFVDVLGGV